MIRFLAGEALKYGWMTNTESESDTSSEASLRALPADGTFQVGCPEDGEFGAMALMLAEIAWRLVLEREWLSHQLCRAADNTTQTSCGSGSREERSR